MEIIRDIENAKINMENAKKIKSFEILDLAIEQLDSALEKIEAVNSAIESGEKQSNANDKV